MTGGRRGRSWFRRSHRWLGVVAIIPLVVIGTTGFLLEHPTWLGKEQPAPTCVAADPGTPGRLLRGMEWGVEESLDGGATWRDLPMLAPPARIIRILFGPLPGDDVVVLGTGSLIHSQDGGHIWKDGVLPDQPEGKPLEYLDAGFEPDGGLILLTDRGSLRQEPGSGSWEWIPPGPTLPDDGLLPLIHDLHTGQVLQRPGRLVAEVTAVILVLLVLSGGVLLTRNGGGKANR